MPTNSSAELRLTFSHPRLMVRDDNSERVAADAQLVFALNGITVTRCEPFPFVAPLGLLEANDIKWYLERYYIWPVGLFKEWAERIEQQFPVWGEKLLATLITTPSAQTTFQQWLDASAEHEPVISLHVLTEDTPETRTAASRLLGFPWELLRHGTQYLLANTPPVRIRRNLPNLIVQTVIHYAQDQRVIRILALSPRPEKAGYIDHRASIKPLVEAVEGLGERAELVRVNPATFERLEAALQQAKVAEKPFHVLHFDGHGVFDVKQGKGALCFESPLDEDKLAPDIPDPVHADKLAALLTKYPLPLVFLDACQTGQSEAEKQKHTDPNASVAAALLQAGVASVIAMSHSVLVETARRFVSAFYQQLTEGQRIGSAVLAGRQALMQSTDRINIAGAGTLQMQDWFVPVLYQREDDPHLFSHALQLPDETEPAWLFDDLLEPNHKHKHTFIGRSRDLLKLERLLDRQPYAVIRGMGGIGKTAVAVELARWLVQCRRFERCAFVSVETYTHERVIVDVLGRQLVDKKYSVAEYGDDLDAALQPIMQVLQAACTLLVIDNIESLLADVGDTKPLLALADRLLKSSPQTRLLFTTREPLPAPFNHNACDIELGALSLDDAKKLVIEVMNNEGWNLHHDDTGNTPEEVDALVNSVGCHARALVLLARELAQTGVTATTDNVRQIMQGLELKYPGERENSLFASVELSLLRLSPNVREQIVGLAVCQGGGQVGGLSLVLDVEPDHMSNIAQNLNEIGLAHMEGDYGYLHFDPALTAYLSLSISDEQRYIYQQSWLDMMGKLVEFLYYHLFQDAKRAAQLTSLEQFNLMRYLQLQVENLAIKTDVEYIADQTIKIEQLFANTQQKQYIQQIVIWRQQIVQHLGDEWSRAHFEIERMTIERLLQGSTLAQALTAAQNLLLRCQQAGDNAYQGADYDLALAIKLMGQTLKINNQARQALSYLQQAQLHFEQLGNQGTRMAAAALKEQGDCWQMLEEWDHAEMFYTTALQSVEKLPEIDTTWVAVINSQLANINLLQERYKDALQCYEKILLLFQQLGEPRTVAGILYQIGVVHKKMENYPQAELYYQKSLSLRVIHGLREDEATSLGELGNLYDDRNYPQQAVNFYRQAANIADEIGNKYKEGIYRSSLAKVLIQQGKPELDDEARVELLRAIECQQVVGHDARPWTTWDTLHNLEQASGNVKAAQTARQQAVKTYMDYRWNREDVHSGAEHLCLDVAQAMGRGDTAEVEQQIEQLLDHPEMTGHKNFLHKLQAIIAGERDLTLAEDEGLHYELAAELILLLEGLRDAGI